MPLLVADESLLNEIYVTMSNDFITPYQAFLLEQKLNKNATAVKTVQM